VLKDLINIIEHLPILQDFWSIPISFVFQSSLERSRSDKSDVMLQQFLHRSRLHPNVLQTIVLKDLINIIEHLPILQDFWSIPLSFVFQSSLQRSRSDKSDEMLQQFLHRSRLHPNVFQSIVLKDLINIIEHLPILQDFWSIPFSFVLHDALPISRSDKSDEMLQQFLHRSRLHPNVLQTIVLKDLINIIEHLP